MSRTLKIKNHNPFKLAAPFLLILALVMPVKGQQLSKLFGAHTSGTNSAFSSISTNGGGYNVISGLNGLVSSISGETTFDDVGLRYFVKSGSTIYTIDALSGTVTDSIPNAGSFHNIEYDGPTNSLKGLTSVGKSVSFRTYNLSTKTTVTKAPLISVDSFVVGESTFDPLLRRYFSMTNLGLVVIDSNGVLVDVLCSGMEVNGMEYDPISNHIFYLVWNGDYYDFMGVEANTCTIKIVGTLVGHASSGRRESTFDKTLGHYYNRTSLGLLQIDTQSGLVLQTFTPTNNFGGKEYASVSATNIRELAIKRKHSVFPNPSTSQFHFSNLELGSKLEVFDVHGRRIFQSIVNEGSLTLDLEAEAKGVYFYRIYDSSEAILQGKLILK